MWTLNFQSESLVNFVKTVAFDDEGVPCLELMVEFNTYKRTCYLQIWRCGIPETEPQWMSVQDGVGFLMHDGATAKDVLEEIGNVS